MTSGCIPLVIIAVGVSAVTQYLSGHTKTYHGWDIILRTPFLSRANLFVFGQFYELKHLEILDTLKLHNGIIGEVPYSIFRLLS